MAETIVQQHVAPVPNLTGVTKQQGTDLTPSQQKHLDEVLAHFSKPDYELSVKEGDKKLKEEEKYWLVGSRSCTCRLEEMTLCVR
jgi:hypothetical protein